MSLYTINTAIWEWMGSERRHQVKLEHNTITGKQRIWVDASEHYESTWKFRLTGTLYLTLDASLMELHLISDAVGTLYYRLTLNGALVPLCGGNVVSQEAGLKISSPQAGGGGAPSKGSPVAASPQADAPVRWRVCKGGGGDDCSGGGGGGGGAAVAVEFSPKTMVILVGGSRVEAEGKFVEEPEEEVASLGAVASGVRYNFHVAGDAAELTVLPSSCGRKSPQCVLKVAGCIYQPLPL